ncbi:hypothetical protein GCM10010965_14980 [Caldalkalibacillus thermarum]|nr:hypothetical protein GCM10010965_14980 [Caldalkalibacillus thermarum]
MKDAKHSGLIIPAMFKHGLSQKQEDTNWKYGERKGDALVQEKIQVDVVAMLMVNWNWKPEKPSTSM